MHKVVSSNRTIYSIYDFHMHLAPALPRYHNLSANPALHPSEVVQWVHWSPGENLGSSGTNCGQTHGRKSGALPCP